MSGEQSIASLGLRVDSSQVTQANRELDKLEDSASRAESAVESLNARAGEASGEFEGFGDELERGAEGGDSFATSLSTVYARMTVGIYAFTAAAVAVGVLVRAYIAGAQENEAFARSIAETGNAMGYTTGQLALMAEAMDDVEGTQGKAAETLAILAATGKIAGENLQRFAQAAQGLERSVGTPVEQTAKVLADLADKPSKAAAELQKSYNFLTPAIYSVIQAQEKAGDIAGAAATAQTAYAAALEKQRTQFEESVPPIVRGWNAIKDAAKESWDAMLGVGRGRSPEERLQDLIELRADRGRALGEIKVGVAGRGEALSQRAADEEERKLIAIVDQRKKDAEAQAKQKQATDAYVESQRIAAEQADEFAEAQKRINAAWGEFNISELDRNLSLVLTKNEAALNELEAQRKAHLVTEAEYYDKRRLLVEKAADAQVSALRAENAELAKQDGLTSVERIAAQNKIAENASRIAEIRIRTASELRVLDTQEQQALRETAAAYEDAAAAAQRYVDTLQKRFRMEEQGIGLGDKERSRIRERAELQDRFEQRRQRLDEQRRAGDITKEEYDRFLKIEEDALKQSEDAFDEHYRVLDDKQSDWRNGALEALANFRDQAKDVAGEFEELFTNAFDGIADSLVEFATTGKSSFGDLARSILADLLKIELRIALSQILGSIFGNGGSSSGSSFGYSNSLSIGSGGSIPFGGGRANGGPVSKGVAYLVNENTPRSEMFVAPADGWVGPAGRAVNNNYYNIGAGVSVAQVQAMIERSQQTTRAGIQDDRSRGRDGWSD